LLLELGYELGSDQSGSADHDDLHGLSPRHVAGASVSGLTARAESDAASLTGEMGQALACNRPALSKNDEDVYRSPIDKVAYRNSPTRGAHR
jgi:hypothetical protein